MMTRILALTLMLLFTGLANEAGAWERGPATEPGAFDYYILSLGWSPTYCSGPGGQKEYSQEQCSRPLGFIVHGLWPEIAGGAHPDSCAIGERLDFRNLAPVMTGEIQIPPGANGLMIHEWKKHGTCSGLSQKEYFQTLHDATAKIRVPDALRGPGEMLRLSARQVKDLFVAHNPELSAERLEVRLNRDGKFAEVRFCFSKDLQFTECRGMQMIDGGTQGVFPPVTPVMR